MDEHEVHDAVDQRTDGLGADVGIEARRVPDAFELTADLVRCGGPDRQHRRPRGLAALHLEKLWAKQVTITTASRPG